MPAPPCRKWRGRVLVAGTILCVLACRSNTRAGRAARGAAICAEFCGLVVRCSDPAPNGNCHRGCLAQWDRAGETCQPRVSESLRCEIHQASRDRANRVTSRCLQLKERAEACVSDCQLQGIVQSGELSIDSQGKAITAQFQLHVRGCEACVPEPGARADAACSSPKICQEFCFGCRTSQRCVPLRACVDGHCAGPIELSALATQLVPLQGCTVQR